MNNLIQSGNTALVRAEISRVRGTAIARQSQQSRSQFTASVTGYDAEQGHAIASLQTGGTVYARSISNSALKTTAVSLPGRSTVAIADAKPIA